MWGERFLGAWIATILLGWAVLFHTQAALVTTHCPPNEQTTQDYATPENCASLGVLFARSADDFRSATGEFIDRNRDDITAVSTLVVAVFTGTLWWVTWGMVRIAGDQRADALRSIKASEEAARAAESAAKTASEQFEMSHRPWIPPGIIPAGEISFGEDALSIPVMLVTRNTGNSPAFNVTVDCKGSLVPVSDEKSGKRPDPSANNQRVLASDLLIKVLEDKKNNIIGTTLFPQEHTSTPFVIRVSMKDIEAELTGPPARPHIAPLLYGTVIYESIAGSAYETGFAVIVMQGRESHTPGTTPVALYPILPANGNVAAGYWTLVRHPNACGRTT
jgi:hypothetical protein